MAKRTYSTAYGKKAARSGQMYDRAGKIWTAAGYVAAGAASVAAASGNIFGAAAGIGVATVAFGSGRVGQELAQGKRAKAFAIDHLVNYSRRNSGGSAKQIEANAHGVGVVKGHYATSKSGKSYFVQQHTRKAKNHFA